MYLNSDFNFADKIGGMTLLQRRRGSTRHRFFNRISMRLPKLGGPLLETFESDSQQKLVLIGYSKGANDILEALVAYPELRPSVRQTIGR